MKDSVYIIVTKKGFSRAVKNAPTTLSPDERAFELDIEVPDEAFRPPAPPKVRMCVPAGALYSTLEAVIEDANPQR